MTDKATQIIADEMRADGWTSIHHKPVNDPGECAQCDSLHHFTARRILAALGAARIELVELPEREAGWWDACKEDGDRPDHNTFSDGQGDFAVTTWNDYPGEVQIGHQGEPLEPIRPAEARALAAALLAAAHAAEAQP